MGYGYYTRTIDGVERHMGYAVVCECDHPRCHEKIDRGLDYLCGEDPGETEHGCGRYFCGKHRKTRTYRDYDRDVWNCGRCRRGQQPWPMKPDLPDALNDVEFSPARFGESA